MGQHIGTAVARILADELEVDWSNVRVVLVDTDPKWGVMSTGGSKSMWLDFPVYSRAGAAGRIALTEAGAKLLGASPSQCVARQGAVLAANRSIPYGEIVRRGQPTREDSCPKNSRSCRLSRPPSGASSAKRPMHWTSRRRSAARRVTASMRRSQAWSTPGQKFPRPLRFGGPRGRRFRGQAGQRISHKPRARGPLQHRTRMGCCVRDVLSGGDPCHRPRQGRLDCRRRWAGFGARHPRSRRQADRCTTRRRALG